MDCERTEERRLRRRISAKWDVDSAYEKPYTREDVRKGRSGGEDIVSVWSDKYLDPPMSRRVVKTRVKENARILLHGNLPTNPFEDMLAPSVRTEKAQSVFDPEAFHPVHVIDGQLVPDNSFLCWNITFEGFDLDRVSQLINNLQLQSADLVFAQGISRSTWKLLQPQLTKHGLSFCKKRRRYPSLFFDTVLFKSARFELKKQEDGFVDEELCKLASDQKVDCDITSSVASDALYIVLVLRDIDSKKIFVVGALTCPSDLKDRPDLHFAQINTALKKAARLDTDVDASETGLVFCLGNTAKDARSGKMDTTTYQEFLRLKSLKLDSIGKTGTLVEVCPWLFKHDVPDLEEVVDIKQEKAILYRARTLQVLQSENAALGAGWLKVTFKVV